jgi:hypothetical protein
VLGALTITCQERADAKIDGATARRWIRLVQHGNPSCRGIAHQRSPLGLSHRTLTADITVNLVA